MDDALSKSLSRIVSDNQKARAQSSERAARLMDVLCNGTDRDKYTETVNDIIDTATGSTTKIGEVLGEDGKPQSPDGSTNSGGS